MPTSSAGIIESDIALQVCTAGNLRTTLLLGSMIREVDQFDRFLIATDTPTGSGIMPLDALHDPISASLGDMPPEMAIAAATGNNARLYNATADSSRPDAMRMWCCSMLASEVHSTTR